MYYTQAPPFRYYTPKAFESITKQFGWPYESWMQDWPLEIWNKIDIELCLREYPQLKNDDEKFLLMEGILYVLDEIQGEAFEIYSQKTMDLLKSDFHIHEYTIYYWTLYDKYPNENETLKEDEIFRITPLMRHLWNLYNKR